MFFDQSAYDIRCDWGDKGISILVPVCDVLVIVDVLSFSTSLDIAVGKHAVVYPYRWKDEGVYAFAEEMHAEVTERNNPNGFSLSPGSLVNLPDNTRLVLPSPNGSTITLAAGSTPVLAGCFRNSCAVAESAMTAGRKIGVIPAGERWEDHSLRPCFEDLAGAGAVITHLEGTLSPEAEAAKILFENCRDSLTEKLRNCGSGKEKIAKDEARDIDLAAELDVSHCVPFYSNGAYRRK